MAVFLGCTSTGRVGLCFLWFFVQELPAVVLVLKRLRRRGKWLEVSSDRLGELGILYIYIFFFSICFCGRVPWLYQYWPGGFMLFVVLCPGTPEGSTGSGSGFKASQKTGQRLKVSSDRLGEAGNRTCDPWFTRHRFIPYTTAASTRHRFIPYTTAASQFFQYL